MPDHVALLMGRGADLPLLSAYLNEQVLPFVVDRLNSEQMNCRLRLYDDEPVPVNQRNLTDVRNRVALIMEYEFARALEEYIASASREQIRVGYVVANRFPDVALRDQAGSLGLRFELKAIDVSSEETAANFDTLVKDIRKGADFVVVFCWNWVHASQPGFRVPLVHFGVALSAYDLAIMRDSYWLGTPPSSVGEGRQGFDLCFAVNCSEGSYNKEEGNLGKLMRLLDPESVDVLPADFRTSPTVAAYLAWRKRVLSKKLEHAAREIIAKVGGMGVSRQAKSAALCVSFVVGLRRVLLVAANDSPTRRDLDGMRASTGADFVLLLNEKFGWWVQDKDGQTVAKGKKVEEAVRTLQKILTT